MRYVMNSAVISTPGTYHYRLVSVEEAKKFLDNGPYTSFVGYPATAEYIERVLGYKISLSREPVQFQPGDKALVVRLKYRVQDPGTKGQFVPKDEDFELGILTFYPDF